MIALHILIAIYLAGAITMLGYSIPIYSHQKKQLLILIRIILLSWFSIGSIAGALLIEKRQREAAFAEAQRKAIEQQKHQRAPILYKPS
ncbi:MAG: hypothetical protein IMZ53_13055 [Thermoplasmata archaeon]|nr:hypothetical protein [Thermoplasmata archaeon]